MQEINGTLAPSEDGVRLRGVHRQLATAPMTVAQCSSIPALRGAFKRHLKEPEGQAQRLAKVARLLDAHIPAINVAEWKASYKSEQQPWKKHERTPRLISELSERHRRRAR